MDIVQFLINAGIFFILTPILAVALSIIIVAIITIAKVAVEAVKTIWNW